MAATIIVLLSVGLTGASADPLPVTYTIDGIAGTNNWYRGHPSGDFVVVQWHINVPVINSQGCGPTQVDGPTTGTTRTCTVTLNDGTIIATTTRTIKIDAQPPTGVRPHISRSPDFNGWYNHPVGLSWTGTDATSGIASCSVVTYVGPDRAAAPISGGCVDKAGNGASAPVSINYDATAPVLSNLSVKSKAGSDLLRWTSSSPSDAVVIQRWVRGAKPPAASKGVVFRGTGSAFADAKIRSNIEYRYAVQTFDQAGNASRRVTIAGLPKVLTLRKMPYTPRAASEPVLRWGRARGATYYHLQLFRGSKRILAIWPRTHQLELQSTWKWSGHRYRLRPGRYRWYVWAGLGQRSFARYRTIGSAQFIIPR